MDTKTNFQRIKEMTAEELAMFISYIVESDEMMIDGISDVLEKCEEEKPKNFDSIRFWLEGPSY